MFNTRTTLLPVLFFLQITFALSQTNLNKGWENFNANNLKQAREFFDLAKKENVSLAEANLTLTLINEMDGKKSDAFQCFNDFFKASENPYPYLFSLWSTKGVFGY